MEWFLMAFKKYADFTGRARRKEYWMFTLFNVLAMWVLMAIAGILGSMFDAGGIIIALVMLYLLIIIVPSLAVTARRLHDINKSGWYYLVSFIPFIGGIWFLVLTCTEGDRGANTYGEDPKNPSNELDEIGII